MPQRSHQPIPASDSSPARRRLLKALKRRLLRKAFVRELSAVEALDLAAHIATEHPMLATRYRELRSLLRIQAQWNSTVEQLAGEPQRLLSLEDLADGSLKQARIAGEAVAAIWDEELLPSSEVARRFGAKPTNREKVNAQRRRSHLLGLPREGGRMYLYPAFQIDAARQEIYPEVSKVNQLFDAYSDPWGAASWWVSDNARLGGRPIDLIGTAESPSVLRAAEALLEPIG